MVRPHVRIHAAGVKLFHHPVVGDPIATRVPPPWHAARAPLPNEQRDKTTAASRIQNQRWPPLRRHVTHIAKL